VCASGEVLAVLFEQFYLGYSWYDEVTPIVHMENRKISPKITSIPTLYPGGKRLER